MIKIQKGNSILTVTNGAYKNYYKHLGYEPVGVARNGENLGEENTHPAPDSQHLCDPTQLNSDEGTLTDEDGVESDEEEAEEEVDLSEIPLSEMGFDELCEYADQLGLYHDGIRSKKEMRALIRAHLN